VLLAGLATAQGPPVPAIHHDLSLLLNPGVRKELKLDEAQVAKARQLFEQTMAKVREQFQTLSNLEGQERTEKAGELADALNAETAKALADLLRPEQLKRYEQINLQQSGPGILAFPKVQEPLKLNDRQKEGLRQISERNGQEIRDLFQQGRAGDRGALRSKLSAVRARAMEEVVNLLDEDQKAIWRGMIGAPFTVEYQPPRTDNDRR
jgi:hypothetical protein